MKYEITTTDVFDNWLQNVSSDRARIADRILRIENGNFGDFKNIEGALYELRFFFGAGYRVYFTIRSGEVVLLLSGGDKSSQKKDIRKAKQMLKELE